MIIGILIFWVGYAGKLAHWTVIGLFLGSFILAMGALAPFARTNRAFIGKDLLGLCLLEVHIYLLFRFQFWPDANLMAYLSVALFIAGVALLAPGPKPVVRLVITTAFMVLGTALYFTPSWMLHEHPWYRTPIARTDALYWYRDSWFLRRAGRQSESEAAMDSCLAATERRIAMGELPETAIKEIMHQQELLRSHTWMEYDDQALVSRHR